MVRLVSRQTGVPVEEILSEGRTAPVVKARHRAMLLVRVVFGDSYPQIGRLFGGRDHSTVIRGLSRALGLPPAKRVKRGLAALVAETLTPQLYYTLLFEGVDAIDFDVAAKTAARQKALQEIDCVLAA